MTPDEYCRALEAHLTRKNDGHLIRIVGPAFDLVRAWSEQGIPYKIAAHGVDRAFERYHARATRRRPFRIEYAEADVLDAFDHWRRAVGLRHGAGEDPPGRRPQSLASHILRALERLEAAGTAGPDGTGLHLAGGVLAEVAEALASLAARAQHVRGEARDRILSDLRALDRRLLDAARDAAGDALLAELEAQSADELRPFRDRMPAQAWRQARQAAQDRLLRDAARLPTLAME